MRRVGIVFFSVGYGSAYIAALSYPGGIGGLYVPVVGPWVTMKQAETTTEKTLLAANGTLQGAGAILLIGGIVGAGTQLVRKPPEEANEAKVQIAPAIGRRTLGVAVGTRF